ncbi:class I SAM-dependent methyltransferase, partial [Arsukibacterium sp.]|uniref:class I SAM-dependent methyltransferase n=1 Tax=Arsukibacterium sp. TaxID=1977258 RepID=UPI002FDB8132
MNKTIITNRINIITSMLASLVLIGLVSTSHATQPASAAKLTLQQLAEHPNRSAEHQQRNKYRNPTETLSFFGLAPHMSVLELWPARGWYTEILAPFLKDQGQLTIAHFRHNDGSLKDERQIFWARLSQRLAQRMAEEIDWFGPVNQIELEPPFFIPTLAPEQFDMVLTFRNAPIWDERGHLLSTLQSIYDVLKPGGVLGMVEHRAAKLSELTSSAVEGYLDEAYVIAAALQVGFVLAGSSDINA